MKRSFYLFVFLWLLAACPATTFAADAALLAWQQDVEERLKRATATLEDNLNSLNDLQKKVVALQEEMQKLRQDLAETRASAAHTDTLKRLADQLQEVDNNRRRDLQLVTDKINDVSKALASAPPPPAPPPSRSRAGSPHTSSPAAPPSPTDEGFWYEVEPNDTLGGIVAAYRKQGILVTRKMVTDANANVVWERIQPGQKIWIPKPK